MTEAVSHAELLRLYAEAQVRVINEWSGAIDADIRELRTWCDAYASAHRIRPVPPNFWASYIFDEGD